MPPKYFRLPIDSALALVSSLVFSPFRVIKYIFSRRKGLSLALLGEAIFRHLEGMKCVGAQESG